VNSATKAELASLEACLAELVAGLEAREGLSDPRLGSPALPTTGDTGICAASPRAIVSI
jgi:hypothetical protein